VAQGAGKVGAVRRLLVAVCLLLVIACGRDTLDRNEWERMSRQDRVLYIKSLIGAEQVKEAKGGGAKTYDRPAEVYLIEINRAYARGDRREVHEVFAELAR
jgi:hypothetical protein